MSADRSAWDEAEELADWSASGAMALTGRPGRAHLTPPAGLVSKLRSIAEQLSEHSAVLGCRVDVDPLQLLVERSAIAGFEPQGQTSCGSGSRLIATHDGWAGVTLTRPEDIELVPAWLGRDVAPEEDAWAALSSAALRTPTDELVDRGAWLGLPVAGLGERSSRAPTPGPFEGLPVRATRLRTVASCPTLTGLRVVDLSSLWAGPLCGSLLVAAGADVIKVESSVRPDGARHGPVEFFDLLNGGKRSVALDFRSKEGVRMLCSLLADADVVIEASRPRALEQLGVDATALLSTSRPRVWASITGYGRQHGDRDRVAFGDDAAVAGGLVSWDEVPCFCADAVADPVTGLVAAAAILVALATGGRWLLDLSMADAAAHASGRQLAGRIPTTLGVPVARQALRSAPALGAHNAEVFAALAAG